jgi:MFS family permease
MAVDRFGFAPRENAYLFVFIGLIIAFVQGGPVRQLAPVHGEKALAIFGLAALVPGLIVTGLAARVGSLYLGLALMALGSAFVSPSLSALVSLYTPPDRQGGALGIFRSLGALGRAVGPLLACVIYWRFGSETPYLAGAALLLVPLGMALGLPAPRKDEGGSH